MFVASVMAMIGYFWLLFLTPREWFFLGRTVSDWAVIVPIMIIVYAFLFVVAWIGRTMASTPPPLPDLLKTSEEEEKTGEKED